MANGYTYPQAPARVTQGGTALEIHQFLKQPNQIARRVLDLVRERFIADFLLVGRAQAIGGSVILENGDEVQYMDDDPTAVAPGGEYSLTKSVGGTLQTIRTTKWGLDTMVTDEAISRELIDPVNRSFQKLANNMIRYIDGVALAVIASRILAAGGSVAASGSWVGDGTETGDRVAAQRIIRDMLRIKAAKEEELVGFGYNFDTVVLRPSQHAVVVSELIISGMLPREAGNPLDTVANGGVVNALGMNWATSTHVPFSDPFIVDRDQLGGMASENIESPGYSRRSAVPGDIGVEVKSIRDDENDQWRLRSRRVTVPYVLDGKAGFRITGTGL